MNERFVLIKLGGSVITEKGKEKTVNHSLISRAFREMKESKNGHPIVIHGAGSFGHPMAKKYDLVSGITSSNQEQVPWAVSVTRMNMIELHYQIIKAALENSFNPFSLPVSSNCFEKENGKVEFFYNPILLALKHKFNPVLYGDVILSRKRGFTILSGDRIMSLLLDVLRSTPYFPSEVIFCTDVDGFFTDDPKLNPKAELIPIAKRADIPSLMDYARESSNPDVTRGMLGKLEQISEILEFGIPVKIVNLTKESRLFSSLTQKDFIGTVFLP